MTANWSETRPSLPSTRRHELIGFHHTVNGIIIDSVEGKEEEKEEEEEGGLAPVTEPRKKTKKKLHRVQIGGKRGVKWRPSKTLGNIKRHAIITCQKTCEKSLRKKI